MPWELNRLSENELVDWIETHATAETRAHARGYQGQVFLYQNGEHRLIVKAASGSGVLRWIRRRWLRKEYAVYKRLAEFSGSPRCHGLLRGRYLILEYVDGVPLRRAEITDRGAFFDRLLEHIKDLHRRGVAHADLKRQDNLLVVGGQAPCLIDFGAAIVYKPGCAPINHFLYDLARRFDLNAWVKLKYRGKFENLSAVDQAYYNRTWIEKIARPIKKRYKKLKSGFVRKTKRAG